MFGSTFYGAFFLQLQYDGKRVGRPCKHSQNVQFDQFKAWTQMARYVDALGLVLSLFVTETY